MKGEQNKHSCIHTGLVRFRLVLGWNNVDCYTWRMCGTFGWASDIHHESMLLFVCVCVFVSVSSRRQSVPVCPKLAIFGNAYRQIILQLLRYTLPCEGSEYSLLYRQIFLKKN